MKERGREGERVRKRESERERERKRGRGGERVTKPIVESRGRVHIY